MLVNILDDSNKSPGAARDDKHHDADQVQTADQSFITENFIPKEGKLVNDLVPTVALKAVITQEATVLCIKNDSKSTRDLMILQL